MAQSQQISGVPEGVTLTPVGVPEGVTLTPVQSQVAPVKDAQGYTHVPQTDPTHPEGVYGMKDSAGNLQWVPYSQVRANPDRMFSKSEYQEQYNKDFAADPNRKGDTAFAAAPTQMETIRNTVLHPLNSMDAASQPRQRPRDASMGEMLGTDLYNVGAGATGVVRHPVDTAIGALNSIGGTILAPAEKGLQAMGWMNPRPTVPEQFLNEADTNGPAFGATMLGQGLAMDAGIPFLKGADATGGVLLGDKPRLSVTQNPTPNPSMWDVQKGVEPGDGGYSISTSIPSAANWLGTKMQNGGIKLINNTVGPLLADVKHDANPGEGYFQARLWPSASMRSIADKAAKAKNEAGRDVDAVLNGNYPNRLNPDGTVSDNAATIPVPDTVSAYPQLGLPSVHAKSVAVPDVISTISKPFSEASDTLNGAFGPGSGALDDRMKSFGIYNPTSEYATELLNSVHSGEMAPGDIPRITPKQLWEMKKNVADNVRWAGADPANASLQDVGQGISGDLSGLLKDTLPQVAEPMERYQNLAPLASRTAKRAATGSMPLTRIMQHGPYTAGLGAMTGLLTHNPWTGLGAAAGALALDSPLARTMLASGLYYGGEALKGGFRGVKPGEYGSQPFHPDAPPFKVTPPNRGGGGGNGGAPPLTPINGQGNGAVYTPTDTLDTIGKQGEEPHDPTDLTPVDTAGMDSLTGFRQGSGSPIDISSKPTPINTLKGKFQPSDPDKAFKLWDTPPAPTELTPKDKPLSVDNQPPKGRPLSTVIQDYYADKKASEGKTAHYGDISGILDKIIDRMRNASPEDHLTLDELFKDAQPEAEAPTQPEGKKTLKDFLNSDTQPEGKKTLKDFLNSDDGSVRIPDFVKAHIDAFKKTGNTASKGRLDDFNFLLRNHEAEVERRMQDAVDKNDLPTVQALAGERDRTHELRGAVHYALGNKGSLPDAVKVYDLKSDPMGFREQAGNKRGLLRSLLQEHGFEGYRDPLGIETVWKKK